MSNRVVHKRTFPDYSKALEFETSVDVFKVIHVDADQKNKALSVWYETLDEPIYKVKVKLETVFDDESLPHNGMHVGSCLCGSNMVHVYQVLVK